MSAGRETKRKKRRSMAYELGIERFHQLSEMREKERLLEAYEKLSDYFKTSNTLEWLESLRRTHKKSIGSGIERKMIRLMHETQIISRALNEAFNRKNHHAAYWVPGKNYESFFDFHKKRLLEGLNGKSEVAGDVAQESV